MNAYEIFKEIREGIGEETSAHWSDLSIMRKMNQAQKILWQDLLNTTGDWFLVSNDIVPSASLITFPAQLGRVVYLEVKGSKNEIPIVGTVREKRMAQGVGLTVSDPGLSAYFVAGGLMINIPGFAEEVTLWFQERLLDMHFGIAGTLSTTNKLEFDKTLAPNFNVDYYKNLDVEVWDFNSLPKIETTITAYEPATNLATITGVPAAGDFYGTVPQLPQEGHHIIALDVINKCLLKPGSGIDIEYVKLSYASLREARKEWLDWIALRGSKHSYIKQREQ